MVELPVRSPAGERLAGEEVAAVDLLVRRREHGEELVGLTFEVGERHQAGQQVDALDDQAQVLRDRSFDDRPHADTYPGGLLFEGCNLGVAGAGRELARWVNGGLVARDVQSRKDRRGKHHPHDLTHRVGRVDPVDAELRRQIERQSRLSGASRAADVDDEGFGEPSQTTDQTVTTSRVRALFRLEELGDPLGELLLF